MRVQLLRARLLTAANVAKVSTEILCRSGFVNDDQRQVARLFLGNRVQNLAPSLPGQFQPKLLCQIAVVYFVPALGRFAQNPSTCVVMFKKATHTLKLLSTNRVELHGC